MERLAPFGSHWIEEPTSPDDVLGHAAIARAVAPIAVATGEHAQNRVIFKQLLQARGDRRLPDRRVPARRRQRGGRRAAARRQVRRAGLPARRRRRAVRATSSTSPCSTTSPSAASSTAAWSSTSTTCTSTSSTRAWSARALPRAARARLQREMRAESLRAPRVSRRRGVAMTERARARLERRAGHALRARQRAARRPLRAGRRGDRARDRRRAWRLGVRTFDTAPHYGAGVAEQRLGAALRERPRSELVLSTKVGRRAGDPGRRRADRCSPRTRGSSAASTSAPTACGARSRTASTRLGLDRADVVHVHDPDDHLDEAIATALPALAALRDEGVIGAVGAGMNHVAPLLADRPRGRRRLHAARRPAHAARPQRDAELLRCASSAASR